MTNDSPFKTRSPAVHGLVLAAILLGASGQAFGQTGQEDSPSTADEKRAMSLAAEAKAALAAGKTHDALRGFRDAWALAKTPAIAANLAILEASFGLHREAAEHFLFANRNLPPDASVEQKQAVDAAFETEKTFVVTVKIRNLPAAARVSVDGAPLGPADEIYVDSGRHEVRIEASGYQPATRIVNEIPGGTLAIEFNINPVPVVASPPARADNTPTAIPLQRSPFETPERRSRVPLFIGGGLVLASAAVGTILFVQSKNAFNDAAAHRASLRAIFPGNDACSVGMNVEDECRGLRDANDTGHRDYNLGVGALAFGGVAAVGTAVYWLWPRARRPGAPVADASISKGYALVRASWSW